MAISTSYGSLRDCQIICGNMCYVKDFTLPALNIRMKAKVMFSLSLVYTLIK